MNQKILVTGGAGFIGSHLVDRLIQKGFKVTVFDNLDPQVHIQKKCPNNLNPKANFIKADVCDYNVLKKEVQNADAIFHQAACVGVGQSQYQIKKYIDVNIGGTANLLDILANHKHSVQKLIVAASMSSYGEGLSQCKNCGHVKPNLRKDLDLKKQNWHNTCPKCHQIVIPTPTTEETPLYCNSMYAISKKVQEEMVLNFGLTYNFPVVALRYFNVYGPRQSLSNPYTGVAAIFLSRLKNNHPPVIYEDGLQSRDFVSVYDIVQANLLALEKEEANFEIFNVGSGKPVTILSIAQTLQKLMHLDMKPHITHQYRKGDIRHCISDISKIKSKLGYAPKITFEDGMKELVEHAKLQPAIDRFDHALEELKSRRLI